MSTATKAHNIIVDILSNIRHDSEPRATRFTLQPIVFL
jgi:hypothetical protein